MVKNPPCNAEALGFDPGQGTKIPHTTWGDQKTNSVYRNHCVGINGSDTLHTNIHDIMQNYTQRKSNCFECFYMSRKRTKLNKMSFSRSQEKII